MKHPAASHGYQNFPMHWGRTLYVFIVLQKLHEFEKRTEFSFKTGNFHKYKLCNNLKITRTEKKLWLCLYMISIEVLLHRQCTYMLCEKIMQKHLQSNIYWYRIPTVIILLKTHSIPRYCGNVSDFRSLLYTGRGHECRSQVYSHVSLCPAPQVGPSSPIYHLPWVELVMTVAGLVR